MNIAFTKIFNKFFAISSVLLLVTSINAQTFNAVDKYPTLLKGTSFKDTVYSSIDIRTINNLSDPFGDVEVGVRNLSTTLYEVTFSFEKSGFIGSKVMEVNTFANIPTISVKYRYNFTVVASIVIANEDYVKVDNGIQSLLIDPLANDIFNDPFPKRLVITDTKYGNSKVVNGLVEYTVPQGFDYDVITYAVENITKTQDQSSILLYRSKAVQKDEIKNIVVSEKSSYTLVLPNTLNNIVTPPTNGNLVKINDQVYQYNNTRLGNGIDRVLFKVGNNFITYNIQLKAKDIDAGLVKDDEVFAAINQSITFNVLDNDVVKGTIYNHSPELTHLGNGVFSFTPASNFSGTLRFFYDAGSRLKREVGNITIHVGNIHPSNDFIYNFTVKKNQSHSFAYETPLNGYTFQVVSNPRRGSASTYQQLDPILLSCGKIQGKAVIEYYPAPNFVGKDSFIIAYKIGNQPARNYMLRYTVIDANDACDCGTDCIWPGDVNKDGVVTPLDLLGIGKNYGILGSTRASSSILWNGQGAQDWTNLPNAKYADTNGDGVIDRKDIQAIQANLGKTSALVPTAHGTGRTFPFKLVPHQTEVDSGDLVTFDIVVGDDFNPLLDVYGLSFNVRIPPGFLHESSIKVNFDNQSWLGHLSPLLHFNQRDATGLITAAISRTLDKGISGKGIIGTVLGVVKDEVQGWFDDDADHYYQNILTTGVLLENSRGEQMNGISEPIAIKVNRKKTSKISVEDQVSIYPNPSYGEFTISLQGQDKINSVEIYDIAGQLIKSYIHQDSKQVSIILEGLRNGIYFTKITTDTNQLTKKFVIAK